MTLKYKLLIFLIKTIKKELIYYEVTMKKKIMN